MYTKDSIVGCHPGLDPTAVREKYELSTNRSQSARGECFVSHELANEEQNVSNHLSGLAVI